jgi:hypothetical protein
LKIEFLPFRKRIKEIESQETKIKTLIDLNKLHYNESFSNHL